MYFPNSTIYKAFTNPQDATKKTLNIDFLFYVIDGCNRKHALLSLEPTFCSFHPTVQLITESS